MGIHEFTNSFTFTNVPRIEIPISGVTVGPQIAPYQAGISQTSDVERVIPINWDDGEADVDTVVDSVQPGFHYLDTGMKLYFSDIRVPTKDSSRFVRTRIAGGDKTIQTWIDELKNGRIQLPVISLNRGSHEFNKEKYSPPYLRENKQFVNHQKTLIKESFRPTPYLVNYSLSMWAEHKRDAEHILSQILTRFNPLAEFVVSDGRTNGVITMRFGGANDESEREIGPEDVAKIKYTVSIIAEAWLSLPNRIIPTILGMTNSWKSVNSYDIITDEGSMDGRYRPDIATGKS